MGMTFCGLNTFSICGTTIIETCGHLHPCRSNLSSFKPPEVCVTVCPLNNSSHCECNNSWWVIEDMKCTPKVISGGTINRNMLKSWNGWVLIYETQWRRSEVQPLLGIRDFPSLVGLGEFCSDIPSRVVKVSHGRKPQKVKRRFPYYSRNGGIKGPSGEVGSIQPIVNQNHFTLIKDYTIPDSFGELSRSQVYLRRKSLTIPFSSLLWKSALCVSTHARGHPQGEIPSLPPHGALAMTSWNILSEF